MAFDLLIVVVPRGERLTIMHREFRVRVAVFACFRFDVVNADNRALNVVLILFCNRVSPFEMQRPGGNPVHRVYEFPEPASSPPR